MTSGRATRLVASALVLAAPACAGDGTAPPTVLSDGSAARSPPVVLEGVGGPSILTRVRVLRRFPVATRTPAGRCVASAGVSPVAVVERVGVSGTSVTLLGPARHSVYGCDASAIGPTHGSSWCGHAFGRIEAGRLRDPRLSLTCRGHADDGWLGFAWIQPNAAAWYAVVARRGYSEVYPVTPRVPVRIVTDDVDQERASAVFSVSEHTRDGRRLASYAIQARVSG